MRKAEDVARDALQALVNLGYGQAHYAAPDAAESAVEALAGAIREARNEALEEAAKAADKLSLSPDGVAYPADQHWCVTTIRAMKE